MCLPFALNLVAALAVFIVGRMIARALTRAVIKVCERSKVDVSLGKFLSDMLYALMLALVVLASLDRIGVPTTSAVAIIGAAGLAVGFALQSSLGNFAVGRDAADLQAVPRRATSSTSPARPARSTRSRSSTPSSTPRTTG